MTVSILYNVYCYAELSIGCCDTHTHTDKGFFFFFDCDSDCDLPNISVGQATENTTSVLLLFFYFLYTVISKVIELLYQLLYIKSNELLGKVTFMSAF